MLDRPDWHGLTKDERIARLKPLLAEGLSSSQIAARFVGATRNMVIGYVSRHMKGGLARPTGHQHASRPKKPRKRHQLRPSSPMRNGVAASHIVGKGVVNPRLKPKPPFEPMVEEVEVGVDITNLIGILELTEHTCKYPFGDPRHAEFGFCGKPSLEGKPYCAPPPARSHLEHLLMAQALVDDANPTIKELRRQNEILQEQVIQLREQLGYHAEMAFISRCRDVLRISPTQARLLKVLLTAAATTKDSLYAALYSDRLDPPNDKIIDVVICKLRVNLDPHGITIETLWGQGYRLAPGMRTKLEALLS